MPGLAKRSKDDPTFGRRPPTLAQWVGAGQAGSGCLGLSISRYKFNLAFRWSVFARGKARHAWGPNRPGAQASSIFNLSAATDTRLYCSILTPCHKGCPIFSRERRATGMKGSSTR